MKEKEEEEKGDHCLCRQVNSLAYRGALVRLMLVMVTVLHHGFLQDLVVIIVNQVFHSKTFNHTGRLKNGDLCLS